MLVKKLEKIRIGEEIFQIVEDLEVEVEVELSTSQEEIQ